jgi:hypothetical protein
MQLLADERLVTVGGDPELVDAVVDLAHEALVRRWEPFAVWKDRRSRTPRYRLHQSFIWICPTSECVEFAWVTA